jgi:aspartate racemase
MERILGIVGGTGPESTIDYYRSIITLSRRRQPDGTFPRILINSVEADSLLRHIREGDLATVAQELGAAMRAAGRSGRRRRALRLQHRSPGLR